MTTRSAAGLDMVVGETLCSAWLVAIGEDLSYAAGDEEEDTACSLRVPCWAAERADAT